MKYGGLVSVSADFFGDLRDFYVIDSASVREGYIS
jgi:hypothetical protein